MRKLWLVSFILLISASGAETTEMENKESPASTV